MYLKVPSAVLSGIDRVECDYPILVRTETHVIYCSFSFLCLSRYLMPFPEMEASMIPVHSEDYKTQGKYYNDEIVSLVSCLSPWSLQLCLTFCNPMDCSRPGSSVRGISQARILEWAATSSSRGSPNPGKEPTSSVFLALAGGFFTTVPRKTALQTPIQLQS